MKADPFAQLRLLDVQQLDSRLDALEHQLRSMPEHARLTELGRQRAEVSDTIRDLQVQVSDLTAEQEKADADVEQVKARRERDRTRIDQGLITNPKDLERMNQELVSLERRINDLEDAEIEVMSALEDAQGALRDASAQAADLDAEIAEVTGARDERGHAVQAEAREVRHERELTIDGVPEDLVALYTRLREQKGGVGAAALHRRQCSGCMLTLDAAVLASITAAPTDEVLRCEECNRILVRTGESGL